MLVLAFGGSLIIDRGQESKRKWPDLQMYSPYKCKYPLPEPLVVYTFHEHFRHEKDLVTTQDGIHFHDIARGKQEVITEVGITFERYWEYSEKFPGHPLGFVWRQLRERFRN